ncbi:serine/threonine-protein kinase [Streptomyces sp. NPDC058279]|uniref:serine/threonine-protein kinase n=1 Tax=Streptomyces sp. NPDC058279 TaxID=3346418 RepID=UPI0036F00DE2
MSARPSPAPTEQIPLGSLLGGRYRIQALIGSGGTADVFRGVDQVLGREVAVKLFRPGADTVTADRFCDEALTLARLSHRALVTVYDVGRHGNGSYVVTELIPGITLRTRIDAGPLSPVRVIRLGAEIASALDHVHAHGIIHRDIKPSNVLLGDDAAPFLADFGLARAVDDHSRSEPDTLVGTLAYMAPEQLRGQGAGMASDVYALGLTLLEALTGVREYVGTPAEVGVAPLLRSPEVPDLLPDGLGRLLKAMTDQDPQARPDAARIHLTLRSLGAGRNPRQVPRPALAPASGPAPAPAVDPADPASDTHRAPVPLDGEDGGGDGGGHTRASGVLWGMKPRSVRRTGAVAALAASVVGASVLLVGATESSHAPPGNRPATPEAAARPSPTPTTPGPSTTPGSSTPPGPSATRAAAPVAMTSGTPALRTDDATDATDAEAPGARRPTDHGPVAKAKDKERRPDTDGKAGNDGRAGNDGKKEPKEKKKPSR